MSVPQGFGPSSHAPFKEDAEAERNDTSIALQVALKAEGTSCPCDCYLETSVTPP